MFAQLGQDILFSGQFTAGGTGVAGATIKCQVYRVNLDGTSERIITDGTGVEVALGIYTYKLAASYVNADGLYLGVFTEAASTADNDSVVDKWVVGKRTHGVTSYEPRRFKPAS